MQCTAMGILGNALRLHGESAEALPALEGSLALWRKYFSHNEAAILSAQANLAACFSDLKRFDEALVIKREIYAKDVKSYVRRADTSPTTRARRGRGRDADRPRPRREESAETSRGGAAAVRSKRDGDASRLG